ncbi:hypothetical protein [Fischerella sp. PCC 9605]|uniref:hypothetical protein n=1 Tax=Fischerella sp. PCC 9605 TaxID=1173024 RepID=UPI00047DD2C8|nr:hypothetical protein [Fischerella sp. PCC 9605]
MPNFTKQCPYCKNSNLIEKTNLPGMHFGALVCGECDRHIKWLPDPRIDKQYEERRQSIDNLLNRESVKA